MKNVYAKLLKVQSLIPVIEKDTENPFYKSKYATKDGILEVVMPIMIANGLCFTCPLSNINGEPAIELSCVDPDSGEEILKVFPLIKKDDPQKEGAVITYTHRYAIAAFLNIQLGDDDDGNTASEKVAPKPPASAPSASGSYSASLTLESAGATLVTLKGATKQVKDWDASARSWMIENHKNPMVVSAVKYYIEHEIPFS